MIMRITGEMSFSGIKGKERRKEKTIIPEGTEKKRSGSRGLKLNLNGITKWSQGGEERMKIE